MRISYLEKKIRALETKRIQLATRLARFRRWAIPAGILAILLSLSFFGFTETAAAPLFLMAVLTIISYAALWHYPYERLAQAFKETLLMRFLKQYHPEIHFQFYAHPQYAEHILNNSRLISFLRIEEQNVLRGSHDRFNFYISEIITPTKPKESKKTFNGLLLHIEMNDKDFPKSKILSSLDFIEKYFGPFIEKKPFNFWYSTEDEDSFNETLQGLFPLLAHLIKRSESLRMSTVQNQMTIILESDISLLDHLSLSLNDSFLDKKHYNQLGKNLNSILFLLESLTNDLEITQIEKLIDQKLIEIRKRL